MRKKAVAVAVVFALVLGVVFAQGAFAAPDEDEQTGPSSGAEKPTTEQTDSSPGGGHTPCTIEHKGHSITVDRHALAAHLHHGDDPGTVEGEGCSTEETTTEPTEGTTNTQNGGETNDAAGGTVKVDTCDGKSIDLKPEEKQTLDLHNETRKDHGLKPLCVDPTLEKAARSHSKEMLDKGYFRHESSDGESNGARLKRFGYDWLASGENLAWGSYSYGTPEGTFKRWMKSPGHEKNVLDGNFEEVGIGVASGKYRESAGPVEMYTVDFGTRRH